MLRLDKETSGLIVVAKNDEADRKLSAQFAAREVKKKYVALAHGWVKKDSGTLAQSISRYSNRVRRTRMTTRLEGGTRGGDALSRGAAVGYEVWEVYVAGPEDRYRANAPDSGACGGNGASGGWGYRVWCAEAGTRGKMR